MADLPLVAYRKHEGHKLPGGISVPLEQIGYNRRMVKKKQATIAPAGIRSYSPPHIPMAAIRRFTRQVATLFQPDMIILFGSFAAGKPHKDSDVDILVVMPSRNEIDQSIRIWQAVDAPFPLDLIVRTPRNLQRGLNQGDWFLQEVISKGKVLYEKDGSTVGPQSRSRSTARKKSKSD